MSQNLQLQKTVNTHIKRLRHRRALLTTDDRFRSRHPGLDNFLLREAVRANVTPLRLVLDSVAAGGSGYSVGDQFNITGGTFSIAAVGMVTAVAAGVVTAAKIIDGGQYTVVTPPASATTVILAKNGAGAAGTGLTVNDSITASVTGVTAAELLAGLRAREDVGGTIPIITRARHYRDPRNSSVDYTNNGVPIS